MKALARFLFVAVVAAALLGLAYAPGCASPDGRPTDFGRAVGEGARYVEVGARATSEVAPEPARSLLRTVAEIAGVLVAAGGGSYIMARKVVPPAPAKLPPV